MTILQLATSQQDTRDNIATRDSTRDLINKFNKEIEQIGECSSRVYTNTIGHSFILGHSVNGILGVANGVDSQQIVLGEAGRTLTLVRIVNPNNIYRDYFFNTDFRDDGQPNTANWDTTSQKIRMSSSSDQSRPYFTVATSSAVFYNSQTVTSAIVNADETKFGNDEIHYFLSADGGSHWEEFTPSERKFFQFTGTDLRWKIIFSGNGANSTYISYLIVSYYL